LSLFDHYRTLTEATFQRNGIKALSQNEFLIHKLANSEWFSEVNQFARDRDDNSLLTQCTILQYSFVDYDDQIGLPSQGKHLVALLFYLRQKTDNHIGSIGLVMLGKHEPRSGIFGEMLFDLCSTDQEYRTQVEEFRLFGKRNLRPFE